MKFFAVIKWMLLIVLLATLGVGGAGIYFWNQKDSLVEQQLLQRFEAAAPELRMVLGATRLSGTEAVTLTNVEIRDRRTDLPLFRAKQIIVNIDSHQLIDHQRVFVESIRLASADILLSRAADGHWNWQEYEFHPPGSEMPALPLVTVEDLRVQLNLQHGNGIPTARLLLTSPKVQAIPVSRHGYDLDGGVELPGAGLLKFAGAWDLASRKWTIGGQLKDVTADQGLIRLAQAANPGIEQQLQQIDASMRSALPATAGLTAPAQTASRSSAALQIGTSEIAPLFRGILDVDFDVTGGPDMSVPEFRLRVEIRDGRLSSAAFPVTLTDVNAVLYRDNSHLIFQLKQARDGDASLTGNFEMQTASSADPPVARFEILNFPVTMELQPFVNLRTQRLFDMFQPEMKVSATGMLRRLPDGRWKPEGVNAEFREGSVVYEKFRYPVSGLTGTVVQIPANTPIPDGALTTVRPDDVLMKVELSGNAGSRRFTSRGLWKNPGPETEFRFGLDVADVPIDGRFRDALDEKSRPVLNALRLSGQVSASMEFYRPPGLDRHTYSKIDARVHDASMRFSKFPYDIDQLSGRVTFDSATKHWTFAELSGRHREAELSAFGEFRGLPAPGVLDLTVQAKNGRLDSDLYNALSEPQRQIWKLLDPEGSVDLTTEIHWTAVKGSPAVVRFPADQPVRIYNALIRPKPFPYRMLIDSAVASFDPNDARNAGDQFCDIHSLKATHAGASISASDCWARVTPDGLWQIHLNNLTAVDLQPDDELRAALPASWQNTVTRFSKAGRISIENSELDFQGLVNGTGNTTAAWDMNLRLRDCGMDAGLVVSRMFGLVTAHGSWDGLHLMNRGDLRFDSVEVLEMPLTRLEGPYTLTEADLVLGSREVFTSANTNTVARDERLKAQAYGGVAFLDAVVDVRTDRGYQLWLELENALLESYAARHMPDQKNLKGVVTAWLHLRGLGKSPADATGRGQLQISPAALYELPVMVKLLGGLAQLNFNVQDRTAFDYALFSFRVADEAFQFDPIDLVGESLALRGRGSVGFGGDVVLDFYSKPTRPRAPSIPLVNLLTSGATQWVKVDVRGTTSRPHVIPGSSLDDSMRQFLEAFNPRTGGPIPGLVMPNIFQLPMAPAAWSQPPPQRNRIR
ncbi:MAG: hypothetical protein R3C19_26135 [Planctomycetaceae bacterium]